MMIVGSAALRESIPSLVRLGGILFSMLGFIAIASAVLVTISDSLRKDNQRRRADGAFGKFDAEWRQFFRALHDLRIIEMFRRVGTGVSRWFHWKKQTNIGRVDNFLVGILAAAWICLILL